MNDFEGRGEIRVRSILHTLLRTSYAVKKQWPIRLLVPPEDYNQLDERYQKHNFDIVLLGGSHNKPHIVVEVNYKHGETAARKWCNIFAPLLRKSGIICVTINDFECESLFDKKEIRPLSWQDFIDVINAFKISKVRLEDLV